MAVTEPGPIVLPRRVIGSARSQGPYSSAQPGAAIRRDDTINVNQAATAYRGLQAAAATMRSLFEADGLVSTAIVNFVAMMSTKIRLKAYDRATLEFSKEGLFRAENVLALLSSEWDYSQGYGDKRGLSGLLETMRLEVLLSGGLAVELVLDTARYPKDLVIFPYDSIIFKSKGKGRKFPTQMSAQGQEIELDLPTIFVAESMKTAQRKYSLPLLHSGTKQVHQYSDFLDQAWRVIRSAGMSRLDVSLDYAKVVASAPKEVQADPARLSAYLETVRADQEQVLRGLAPEDALVHYDLAVANSLKSQGEKAETADLIETYSGLTASALKSNPSMLGLRVGGSQNTATTEAMLATKTAELLSAPVADVLSRALTLAVRLYGLDVRVQVEFEPIDLRPELELEAHKAMRQASMLELLSLGRVTDDEAQALLGLGSLPDGAPVLAGTGFRESRTPDTLPVAATNSRNRQITPPTPSSAGGRDNEQR